LLSRGERRFGAGWTFGSISLRKDALSHVQSLAGALCILWVGARVAAAAPNDEIFERVVRQAQAAAAAPYKPNEMSLPTVLEKLNYDTYRNITFRQQRSLWHNSETPFRVQFFHPGYLFKHPVAINAVESGEARPVPFDAKYFRYPDFDPAKMGDQSVLGFAGFRILYQLNMPTRWDELISFLGSSYFRALGVGQIYGISARGIGIDTAEGLAEEFPVFREFWLCKPEPGANAVQLFALLDGPSVSGAYRFLITPGADTTVEVESHLFFRRPVQVLGLASLTSIFWRDESSPHPPNDKRPEVHDSDGLLIERAAGDEQWHALTAVQKITTQLFPMTNPQSFALLQRDRDPAHYRDREAKYERRPSVRVESLGDWGKGNVRLMQLRAVNEYNDNVIAFWQPEKSPAAGDEFVFKYRLHWFARKSNKP
jgi:periplasmic glucans biosynthesis protein